MTDEEARVRELMGHMKAISRHVREACSVHGYHGYPEMNDALIKFREATIEPGQLVQRIMGRLIMNKDVEEAR